MNVFENLSKSRYQKAAAKSLPIKKGKMSMTSTACCESIASKITDNACIYGLKVYTVVT